MATIKLLSARSVATLGPGLHADGGNLFLRVLETGARSWFFRYKKDGKQTSIGLGATHSRSLAQARDVAQEMRTAILNGLNPASVIKQEVESAAITFKQHAEALIDSKRPSWRNAKHAQQWTNTLTQYAYPRIGSEQASEVTIEDMKAILEPIWVKKTETATRLRMRIEAVLDYAALHEGTDARKPARWKGTLEKILPPLTKSVKGGSPSRRPVCGHPKNHDRAAKEGPPVLLLPAVHHSDCSTLRRGARCKMERDRPIGKIVVNPSRTHEGRTQPCRAALRRSDADHHHHEELASPWF